jgi:hypothetical protein
MEPFPEKHLGYNLNLLCYLTPICIRPGNNTNTGILKSQAIAEKQL